MPPVLLPAPINIGGFNDSPQISPDGKTLTFSYWRIDYLNQSGVIIGDPQIGWPTADPALTYAGQIVQSKKIAGVWQAPVCLPKPINVNYAWSADTWVSEDISKYLFTSVTIPQLQVPPLTGPSRFGIFYSSSPGNLCTAAQAGFPMTGTDENPHITRDGLTLFFESQRFGPIGIKDIVMSKRRTVTCPWSAPISLGPTINKPGVVNGSPFSMDGADLYYDNKGGAIWHSVNLGSGKWSTPTLIVSGAVGDPSLTLSNELYYVQVYASSTPGQIHGQIMSLQL